MGAVAPRSGNLAAADADASRDDLDADPDNLGGEDLLARELGASVIEEIKHS
jgi:DNA polymerase-3 subunit gamma/tau